MIWGIDVGVRSLYCFRLDNFFNTSFVHSIIANKSSSRRTELKYLVDGLKEILATSDSVFIEEPPLAGPKNIRVFGGLNQAFGVALATAPNAYSVEVSTWKKEVVGRGNASKDDVREWLEAHRPGYSALCEDQNLIDAACIALYGDAVLARVRDMD